MFSHKHQHSQISFFLLKAATLFVSANCYQEPWSTLNQSVQGRLHVGTPFALPCFSNYNGHVVPRDADFCDMIQQNYTSSTLRTEFYSGFMNSQDEICSSNATDQCLLDDENSFDPLAYVNQTCYQGSVSPYYIDIQEPEDIIEAFQFSKITGVKLSIKNSGHDFLGRSSLKGSLALWTRNLRNLSRDSAFVPEGCTSSATVYNTITVGAGINFDEVFSYADEQNVTFIGGYASTVGASGGWLQGGGHSVLSPVYGLGVDRVVQFKVVTPDGIFRTVNECQNQDLFWALRGGGGGTFGVVTESTSRVEKQLRLSVASIKFSQTASNALPFLDILVNNSVAWGNQGWGGHLGPNKAIYVNPLLSLAEAEESMKTISAYALSQNGTAVIETLSWLSFYQKYILANSVGIGATTIVVTRLIPTTLFETPTGRAQIMAYINQTLQAGMSPYIPVTTPLLYPYLAGSTSANPAWRSSLWELGGGLAWAWNSTKEERRRVVALAGELTRLGEELAPGSGTYGNEASAWTGDWREAFWGVGYERLVSVKRRFDPWGLLDCWMCVGFLGGSAAAGGEEACFEGMD